ncbi:MAG TPA: glycosyl hydrolase [Thermoanaerobaculia bacterium]|nr:glycosyl hydrolase [Thermoanaerobaculia bacterium]
MHRLLLSLLILVALFTPALCAEETPKAGAFVFGEIKARPIGPAVMGGRIAALDATPGSPSTIWVGAASGGVWKSIDDGTTFKPVFDKYTQSIGAIAIDPSSADTVWVGTGESWVRNSVSIGTGVYRTTDGGESWTVMGLGDTQHISRILVHPKKSDTVYVCATGHLWDANQERGVFRTTDGGKNWEKILYVDANTGCSDLAIDPQEPGILYAGMWQFRRYPDFFESGGAGSGLHKSTDGGKSWTKIQKGLPEGMLGRIAVAVSPSRPSVLYALVEAKKTGMYRSNDFGSSWEQVNTGFNVTVRPFYFALVVVDPTDYNRVYKPGLSLGISSDGGKSFNAPLGFGGGVHSDHHALWIDPRNPSVLLLGTDGGLYRSSDRGGTWHFLNSLPISQFYQVSVDNEMPYNVYGGLQDNGSWTGPSRAAGGIGNRHWRNLGGGDGFHVVPDPTDSDVVFFESQGGNIVRIRQSTGETRDIKPLPAAGEPAFRFNWNTPIHASRNEPGTIYLGSQFLFRTRDRGESWERISPDLTTNDPRKQRQKLSGGLSIDNSTAENHTTIITVNESPLDGKVIWVGTDDGNLQLTRDGGKSWTNVVANVPGLPASTWVSNVEAGHHHPGVAYVTFDGHRTGDMKTYVYRTRDFGQSWESLVTGDLAGYAQVIREDPVAPHLLFLGTEFGLFISIDGGANWAPYRENFPPVPVDGIAIHPRDSDVILATHGRGVWIIDDITPLRNLEPEALSSDVVMLPSRETVQMIPAYEQRFDGDAEFSGPTPGEIASIHYYLNRRHIIGDSRVEIYDSSGNLVSTLPAGKRRGINRVEWPMRLDPPKLPPATSLVISQGAFYGPRVPLGTYTVRLVKGKETHESTIRLVPDPRSTHSAEDRAIQNESVMALYRMLSRLTLLVDQSLDLRDRAREAAARLGGSDHRALTSFANQMEAFRATLVSTSEAGWLSGDEKLREEMGALYGSINSYDGRPTASQLARKNTLEVELAAAEQKFESMLAKDLAGINRRLERRRLEPLGPLTGEEWEKKKKSVGTSTAAGKLPRRMVGILDLFFPHAW